MKDEMLEKTVAVEEAGTRLDRCLRLWVPGLPQSMIEKASRKGILQLNGEKAKPSLRVKEGQTVSFPSSFTNLIESLPPKKQDVLSKADRKWLKDHILFEDKEILIVNKPQGISVQGGSKQYKSLDRMFEAYYEDIKPRLVHRLDQDTSGVLVLAKTLPITRWLTQQFKTRKVEKIYWALVVGVPKQKEGTICLALSKKPDPQGEKVRIDEKEGLRAVTNYRVIDSLGKKMAWLELSPQTGRTHQLRVHCAEGIKTPILGDGKYGGQDAFPMGRKPLHLHARKISFKLPSARKLTFEAPLPTHFQNICKELGFSCA